MHTKDNALPENSKENLEQKLDHAIKETFPSSDPVSVSVTKGGAIDYDSQDEAASTARGASGQHAQGTAENLLGQAKETIASVTGPASEAAREAYDQGRRYMRSARERYPEAERYYREGTETVRQYAAENPLLTLLVGVGIGYVLAWMLHSGGSDEGERVPGYAKTRRGYSAHWAQPRA
jgi:ElaB/YqjD/DUF883 family membrane-anchored ribosome-binding protein